MHTILFPKSWLIERLQHGWWGQEITSIRVRNSHIVNSSYVRCAQLLYGGNKPFRARIERVHRHGLVMSLTPLYGLLVFFGSVSRAFAVRNKPCILVNLRPRLVRHSGLSEQLSAVHTHRQCLLLDVFEEMVHLLLIVSPSSANQWHPHCPQAPSQERYITQLALCKPAAPT